MTHLKWKKSYNTQIDILDSQLMDIVDTINVINKSVMTQKDNQEIYEILQSLLTYTTYHFNTEEDILMQISFPNKRLQFAEYTVFMNTMQNYLSLISSGQDISKMRLVGFLNKWIQMHIRNINKCFKNYSAGSI